MLEWNLREGRLVKDRVSDDEFWSLFNFAFSGACKKSTFSVAGLIVLF